MSSIRISHLSVKYTSRKSATEAIHDLSLDLNDGGLYVVIGPSGCGKSTLLQVLGGIINEYDGDVFIDGIKPNPKKHSIGLVSQNYGLILWKKVKENILLATQIRKQTFELDFYNEIIQILDLTEILERYPHELSGGQQQRVALARTFIQKPDLLLLDEPFSALDTLTSEKCRNLFLDVWKKHKVTTLFITHNIEEAVRIGKYIVILTKSPGKIAHVIENPLMKKGIEQSADAYFRESINVRNLINEEWL